MAWPDFGSRATEPEWMDIEDVSAADFAACLHDLETVNRLTRASPPTIGFLEQLTAGWPAGSVLRVADIGYGRGDMLRRIHRWAEARGLRPELMGVDLNPRSRLAAEAATPAGMAIRWHEGDIFDWQPEVAPHAIVSALFTHHLDDAGVRRFLRWQEATASHGWFVNDLHRHWFAWGGFWLLSRVAGWHRFVRHDGPLSVRRAFVAREWRAMLAEAGIAEGATLRWHLPFRLCVGRVKQAG
jgi:hypothetical protein